MGIPYKLQPFGNIAFIRRLYWDATMGLPSNNGWSFGGNSSLVGLTGGYLQMRSTNSGGGNTTSMFSISLPGFTEVRLEAIVKGDWYGLNNYFNYYNGEKRLQEYYSKSGSTGGFGVQNVLVYSFAKQDAKDYKLVIEFSKSSNTINIYIDDVLVSSGLYSSTVNSANSPRVDIGCSNPYDECMIKFKSIEVLAR